MNDEWRLRIDAGDAGDEMVERLASRELEHDLSAAFGDTVIVSRDGDTVFLYAGSRGQAERAAGLVSQLAERNDWQLAPELSRWHPEAEEWKDPDEPLSADPAARQAEHEEAIADERAEVEASGEPRFEVRVDLDSHRDASRFSERLEAEGLPVVRRWRYLVVGAEDEDAAKALAERLRGEAPAGSEVQVEGSGRVAWEERPPNPFAIFGGLGG
ncbi:MAG TPA: hypothetical protein VGI73_01025 [Solirubrobacterales bacterium]|jgi:hypothetical protein